MADTTELIDDIIYYARAGDLDELKDAKFAPEYIVAKNESGNTALHMACANGHTDVITWMIEQLKAWKESDLKAHLEIQNAEGNTPLHWAALNGHLEIVEALVKNGADCKIKNKAGKTPIFEAQQRGFEKIAEFFLQTMIEEEPDEPVDEEDQFVEKGYDKKDD